jgi:hypothetical protein
MELLLVLILFVALDLAAVVAGADSRPSIAEAPKRSI